MPLADDDPLVGGQFPQRHGAAGVEALAYRADVTTEEIRLTTPLPVVLG